MGAAEHLTAALGSLSAAFTALDAAAGGPHLDHHSRFALVDLRGDASYMIRRLKRVALMAGADPARVEKVKT